MTLIFGDSDIYRLCVLWPDGAAVGLSREEIHRLNVLSYYESLEALWRDGVTWRIAAYAHEIYELSGCRIALVDAAGRRVTTWL